MFFVGIAGGSGSGKTTFANKILQRIPEFSGDSVVLLHQDSYYLPTPPHHIKIHGEANFDHPDAFDWNLLKTQLRQLKSGASIEAPVYDYRSHQRTRETIKVGPCKIVLMEGIFSLWDSEIRDIFNLKIFLHVEADIRFIRRFHRDVKERGRTIDSIIKQYYDTVRPMHHEFLEPTRQYADLVVGEETDVAADVVAARVSQIALGAPFVSKELTFE